MTASERLGEVTLFLKRLLFEQAVVRKSWFVGAVLVFLLSLITFRWTFILPIYIFFVGSFIAGVLLINHKTLCPNVLWTHVREIKKVPENVLDEACHVCGRHDCGRHRLELRPEAYNPWIDLEIPETINSAFENFFDLILKKYVELWYNVLSMDEAFVDEIKTNIRFVFAALLRRIQKVDLATLISGQVLNLSMRHLHQCLKVLQEEEKNASKSIRLYTDLEKLKSLEQKLLESFQERLHYAARTRPLELEYLRVFSDKVFTIVLPQHTLKSKTFLVMMRELLAGVVLLPSVDVLCDPDILNNLLLPANPDDSSSEGASMQASPRVAVLKHYEAKSELPKNKNLKLHLTTILSNNDLLFPFMQFMKAESSVNVLQFYLVIEEFNRKILTPELKQDQLLELHMELRKLYDSYFDPSAKDCIRFDSEVTADIKNICEGPADGVAKLQSDPPLFKAYEHIYDLLEKNFLPLYHQSDYYYESLCGERVPLLYQKANSPKSMKKVTKSESLSKLGSKIKGVFKSNAVDGRLIAEAVDYDVQEVHANVGLDPTENIEDVFSINEDEEDSDNDSDIYLEDDSKDLSLWAVSIPKVLTHPTDTSKNKFQIEVKRLVSQTHGDYAPVSWFIERRYTEFFVLENKLKEFHGVFEDCQLPPKKFIQSRDKSFYEAHRSEFENFLRILLAKSTLKSSELVHRFLTSEQEFTSTFLDVNLGKKVKSGAMKLVKEKGQHLDCFLKYFLSSTEATKYRPSKTSDKDSDTISIASEQVINSIYANNANLPLRTRDKDCKISGGDNDDGKRGGDDDDGDDGKRGGGDDDDDDGKGDGDDNDDDRKRVGDDNDDKKGGGGDDDFDEFFVNDITSYYDAALYLCSRLFSTPEWLLSLARPSRAFAKKSVDCYVDWCVAEKLDKELNETFIVSMVNLLKDVLFDEEIVPPRTEEDKEERRKLSFKALLALLDNIPNKVLDYLGKTGAEEGVKILFNLFQLPRLNKQLAYTLLDAVLLELFPELESATKTN